MKQHPTHYEGTLNVFVTDDWKLGQLLNGDVDWVEFNVGSFHLTANDMSGTAGWTKVGSAKVVIDLHTQKQMVEDQINGIKKAITDLQAETQNKITEMTVKLQQLLAIEN